MLRVSDNSDHAYRCQHHDHGLILVTISICELRHFERDILIATLNTRTKNCDKSCRKILLKLVVIIKTFVLSVLFFVIVHKRNYLIVCGVFYLKIII